MKSTFEKDPISFISERTAEYVLVPKLIKILKKKYSNVIPIFPWATREGSNLSKQIHEDDKFYIVGMFPRRPKLDSANDPNIIIKINHQIIVEAKRSLQLGIPMIAGCPLVKNFWELGSSPNCVWIKLEQASEDDAEIDARNIKSFIPGWIFPNEVTLIKYFYDYSLLTNLQNAIQAFKKIKLTSKEAYNFHYFWMGSRYKPVYFLLK
jgi:hypothetical protein